MKIRVYYEDTDLGGVVYHANYLKFCERARSEQFFKRGMLPHDGQVHYFVKSLEAEYKASAKLGDLLDVRTVLLEHAAASFVLHQEIWCEEKLLFVLKITLVHVDRNGKVKRLTPDERKLIEELFG